jgi:hypothetical protein
MKPRELKKLLFQFLQNASDDYSEKDETGKERTGDISSGGETLRNFIDGMSQQTARIIIDGEMEQGSIPDNFEIDRIENKGRYYLARVIGPMEESHSRC